jgi:hypothetical protein
VQRQQEHESADPYFARARRDCRGNRQQRGRVAVVDEVMLGQPDGVVAEILGERGDIEMLAVDFGKWHTPWRRIAKG